MEIVIPEPVFLLPAYVGGALSCLIGALLLRDRVRVENAVSWILLILLGPVPVLFGITLAGILTLPTNAALPPTAVTILLGTLLFHFVLPAVLPDFHTESFLTSVLFGSLLGAVVLGVGFATGSYPAGLVGMEDDIFREAGYVIRGEAPPED